MLKAALSWSSGKDSAMALYRILKRKDFEIACLLTTISDRFHRISMHGVRESLLDAQAHSLNLPIEKVMIPYPCPNEIYEEKMTEVLSALKAEDVTHVIFGDLFLQDIRKYREENLSRIGMTPVFPLWLEDTSRLAREMIDVGFRAVITCVDPMKLNPAFAGCHFDQSFLEGIPANVDPCGENGEFHTFVYDGPIFSKPIPIEIGEIVMRDGFQFADVSLAVGNHSGPVRPNRTRNSDPST
jgi:uncharacterized protein (TIGR00290 family)